jgi:hypothetical protein
MLPLLLQCFRPMTAVFVCPLFFGVGRRLFLKLLGINFEHFNVCQVALTSHVELREHILVTEWETVIT